MKIKKKEIFNYLALFINCFFFIPIMIENLKRRRILVLQIGLFFGGLGYFYRPYYEDLDIARYYKAFDDNNILNQLAEYQRDIYAIELIKIIKDFNLPKYLLGAISAFIVYYFFYKSLSEVLKKVEVGKGKYLKYSITLFLLIPIVGYTGIRFLPAAALACYGIISYEILFRKKIGIIYLVLATFIHSSIWLIIFCILIKEILKIKIKFLKLLSIISLIFMLIEKNKPLFIIKIIDYINSFNYINLGVSTYITGKWGNNYVDYFFSGIEKYYRVYLFWGIQILILLSIIYFSKNKIILILTNLCIIFFPFQILLERYFIITSILSFLFSIVEEKRQGIQIYYKLISLYGLLIFLKDFYDMHMCFYISYIYIYKISFFQICFEILEKIIIK